MLRFSAHFPWTGAFQAAGFPAVGAARELYWVGAIGGTLAQALARVEAALTAWPVQPFLGSRVDHEHRLVTDLLEGRGMAVRRLSGVALAEAVARRGARL